MGGTTFEVVGKGRTVREAFDQAHEAALWEHGHGGYSGTIAEKGEWVEFPLPEGVTAEWFLTALRGADSYYGYDPERGWGLIVPEQPTWHEDYPRWAEAQRVYSDKWGPCVAVRKGDGEWLFGGWASC